MIKGEFKRWAPRSNPTFFDTPFDPPGFGATSIDLTLEMPGRLRVGVVATQHVDFTDPPKEQPFVTHSDIWAT